MILAQKFKKAVNMNKLSLKEIIRCLFSSQEEQQDLQERRRKMQYKSESTPIIEGIIDYD